VSIRFQPDNDLNALLASATLRREPGFDFQTAGAAGWTASMIKTC
jgi:hypothetical protein